MVNNFQLFVRHVAFFGELISTRENDRLAVNHKNKLLHEKSIQNDRVIS